MRKAIWVRCNSEINALLLQYKAVTGHLHNHRHELSAEMSQTGDPRSVDIEFPDFHEGILDEILRWDGVTDVGEIKESRSFRNPEEIRDWLLRELPTRMPQQASSAA